MSEFQVAFPSVHDKYQIAFRKVLAWQWIQALQGNSKNTPNPIHVWVSSGRPLTEAWFILLYTFELKLTDLIVSS